MRSESTEAEHSKNSHGRHWKTEVMGTKKNRGIEEAKREKGQDPVTVFSMSGREKRLGAERAGKPIIRQQQARDVM